MAFTTPDDLRYGNDDMWARPEGDKIRVGITDFAQSQLGDIIFVDMPKVGSDVVAGQPMGEVESTKTISDLVSPVSGTVGEVNSLLGDRPELVNESPYGDGWMLVIESSQADPLSHLMTPDDYASERS
ncbi:MAG: glycine cleavage system protein GcvH [Nitriliruptoraceae bacterium]